MKRLLILAALLALAAPAAFAAPPAGKGRPDAGGSSSSGQSPAALCKEQLLTMGAKSFQSTYALTGKGKNAFGKCVSQHSQKSDESSEQSNGNEGDAAKQCKAERAKDPDAFAKKYGTNANLRNAFGKCVSSKSKEQDEQGDEQDQQGTSNAAKQCKAERANGPDAFAKKYGTNANLRNAFGKCVSSKSKAAGKDEGKDSDD